MSCYAMDMPFKKKLCCANYALVEYASALSTVMPSAAGELTAFSMSSWLAHL